MPSRTVAKAHRLRPQQESVLDAYFNTAEMMNAFLGAPAADGRLNDQVLESVVGASVRLGRPSAVDTRDPAVFDAVEDQNGRRARTFREAFRACAEPYTQQGHRCWRRFDLKSLQACHPTFRLFRLPEWVESAIVEEELAEHYADHGGHDAADNDNACDVAVALAIVGDDAIPF